MPVFWHPEAYPPILAVDAIPAQRDDDALDIGRLKSRAVLLRMEGQPDQLRIGEGRAFIQLSVRSGNVACGPVLLRYAVGGLRDLEAKILTLRRLLGLAKTGTLVGAMFPVARQSQRWRNILEAHDLAVLGASQRRIAEELFGVSVVARDWRGRSDYLRLRVQRALGCARRLVDGGYRALLDPRRTTSSAEGPNIC